MPPARTVRCRVVVVVRRGVPVDADIASEVLLAAGVSGFVDRIVAWIATARKVERAGSSDAHGRCAEREAAAIVTKVTVGQYVRLQVWTNRDHDFACWVWLTRSCRPALTNGCLGAGGFVYLPRG